MNAIDHADGHGPVEAVVDAPRAGTLCEVLANGNGGWSLAGVVSWLFRSGRHLYPVTRLMDELCEQLLAAGAPVWRVRCSFRTLHPQVAAWAVTWVRGCRASEYRVLHGIEQTDAFVGSPIEHVWRTGRVVRHRLERLDPERDHAVLHELAAAGARDYVALPLILRNETTGALLVATDRPEGFSEHDLARLEALTEFLAPILEGEAQRRIARGVLDTYVGRRTGARVLQGLIRRGDSEIIDAALWFSDLRDSTLLTEQLSPQDLLAMLNTYFEVIAAAAEAYGGEILRIIGDAMLIVFPVDARHGMAAACRAAAEAAQDATDSMAPVNHRRRRRGEPAIGFGVGLHAGRVFYGNIGAPDRLDFTVIGSAVNMAARLEGLTRQTGEPVLMSGEFVSLAGIPARSLGRFELRGLDGARELYAPAPGRGGDTHPLAGSAGP